MTSSSRQFTASRVEPAPGTMQYCRISMKNNMKHRQRHSADLSGVMNTPYVPVGWHKTHVTPSQIGCARLEECSKPGLTKTGLQTMQNGLALQNRLKNNSEGGSKIW